MKHLYAILVALIALTLVIVTAGCNESTASSNPGTTDGNNFAITVFSVNGDPDQEIDASHDSTSYTAYPGELGFDLILAGRGGVDFAADYVLYKSDESINYSDLVADLATFKEIKKLERVAQDTWVSYDFITTGRYLVKAFAAGTSNEIARIRLTIVSQPAIAANLQITMRVSDGTDGQGNALQTASILVENTGTVDAKNVTVKLGPNFDFTDSIESVVSWDYHSAASGPKTLKAGEIYKLGASTITRDGAMTECSDALVSSGLPLGTIKAGNKVIIIVYYVPDPNAPGLGFSR